MRLDVLFLATGRYLFRNAPYSPPRLDTGQRRSSLQGLMAGYLGCAVLDAIKGGHILIDMRLPLGQSVSTLPIIPLWSQLDVFLGANATSYLVRDMRN
jgi:hypothetical protein